jgi:hypothetical protein
MGLTLTAPERALLSTLCRPAWIALGLTNDLYSIDKETEAAREMGESHVSNALWVMMRQHALSADKAKALCRRQIRDCVAQYVETVRATNARTDVSHDLKVFVEAIQYVLSGNLVWTRGAPRYNPDATYNEHQLEWMRNGVPETVEPAEKEEECERPAATGLSSRLFLIIEGSVRVLRRVLWL